MPKDSWLLKMRYNCPISLNLGTSEWVEKEGQAFQHWLWGLTYNNGWHSIFLVGQHENWGGEGFQKVLILCVFSHKPTKCLNYGGKRDSVMKSVLTVKQKSVCICANPPPPKTRKKMLILQRGFRIPKDIKSQRMHSKWRMLDILLKSLPLMRFWLTEQQVSKCLPSYHCLGFWCTLIVVDSLLLLNIVLLRSTASWRRYSTM